jgi:beta-lactamase class A
VRSSVFIKSSIGLIAAILLAAAGWSAHGWYDYYHKSPKMRRVHAKVKGFRLTSPLLDVELPEGVGVNSEPLPFRGKVKDFIDSQVRKGQAREVAVYYRDLHDGPWFGINEDKDFDPASMMKVPVMVCWLKRAERNPQVLKEQLTYAYPDDMRVKQNFQPAQSVEPGRSYKVEELLRLMMNYSDNNATRLLFEGLKPEELSEVLDGMDTVNRTQDDSNSVTVHGYSGLFRILYNASYLNREMSEKALQLLSLQDFPQGIVAGVPKGTVVAAKFGERAADATKKHHQLHEFGIVYHPKHTYILGIMTRGDDFGALMGVIRQISQLVYMEVDAGTFSSEDNHR